MAKLKWRWANSTVRQMEQKNIEVKTEDCSGKRRRARPQMK